MREENVFGDFAIIIDGLFLAFNVTLFFACPATWFAFSNVLINFNFIPTLTQMFSMLALDHWPI